MGSSADDFLAGTGEFEKTVDPKRPEAVRGRYKLPHPETGISKSWQRTTTFTKYYDENPLMLVEWKQRHLVRGLAAVALFQGDDKALERLRELAGLDVKEDRVRLNRMVTSFLEAAGANAARRAGTALHKETEAADFALGDLQAVSMDHQIKVGLYLKALREHGLTIPEDMIERVVVSLHYDTCGKFDRIFRLPDGSYAIGDLKTNDSLESKMPSIAAQLECYQRSVNDHGIWDGQRYDTGIRVREDIAIVVHLPSTRDECHVLEVDLEAGRQINAVNLAVKGARRIKTGSISRPFFANNYRAESLNTVDLEQYWHAKLTAAVSRDELIVIAREAKALGQWTQRLGDWARSYAKAIEMMGG